jgi:uncharacterized OB-fold protein
VIVEETVNAAAMSQAAAANITQVFWSSAKEHVLVRQVCADCQRSFFSPRAACPHCLSESWAWKPSNGLGTVYSYSRVERPPVPSFKAPYVLAVVDLEEGWTMLTHLVGDAARQPKIGERVRVAFEESGLPGVTLPVFESATGQGGEA